MGRISLNIPNEIYKICFQHYLGFTVFIYALGDITHNIRSIRDAFTQKKYKC